MPEEAGAPGDRAEAVPRHLRIDGFDAYVKADGTDYWRILRTFLHGGVEAENLKHNRGKRKVHAFDFGGRRYVLKRDLMRSLGLRHVFPGGGWTYHTRIMRKVNRAVDLGCRATPDIYLVAERWKGRFRQEAFVLMEFVEGTILRDAGDAGNYRDAIREAMLEMHRFGLTLSDVNSRNFLVGPDGVKVIDIACRFPDFLSIIRDGLKVKARYNVELPVTGLMNRFFGFAIAVFYTLRGKT
ncbi:MAG: hypothetical protein LBJ46_00910 [Planctomycetota bacterium]|jgi:heptose II phosphotransferase|nr:hypothetical protein [Planctomycetota bacterium]